MIRSKIREVDDSVCQNCSQLWKDECRAYCVPHSDEEKDHRKKSLRPSCYPKRRTKNDNS